MHAFKQHFWICNSFKNRNVITIIIYETGMCAKKGFKVALVLVVDLAANTSLDTSTIYT